MLLGWCYTEKGRWICYLKVNIGIFVQYVVDARKFQRCKNISVYSAVLSAQTK